jgi:L-iditol 2-dehydrogenase
MYPRGHARLQLPAPFGHEFAGTVAAAGEGVHAFREGDPIACVPTAPCGACELCGRGRENLCAQAVGRMVLGAYAEYVLLPAHIVARHVFARPAHIAPQHAAALEPLSCVVHGAHRIDLERHERIAILGDGAIALLLARVAVLRGADVLVLGHHDDRIAIARQFGARGVIAHDDEAAHAAVRDDGASVVVECVGNSDAWRLASDLAPTGGSVLLFGGCAPGSEVTFDAYRLHYEEVDISGAFHYTPRAVTEAWRLITSGEVDPAPLVQGRVPLENIEDALQAMARREVLKVCVTDRDVVPPFRCGAESYRVSTF